MARKVVKIQLQQVPLKEALQQILLSTGLAYRLEKENITIFSGRRKEKP